MKCRLDRHHAERTVNADQTEEDHGQDEHHSAEDLLHHDAGQTDTAEEPGDINHLGPCPEPLVSNRKPRIQWPQAEDRQWIDFDDDLDKILESTLIGDVHRKLTSLSTVVYTVGIERFGEVKQKETGGIPTLNRRQQEIKSLRAEINQITKQYRTATVFERHGLQELRAILRERRTSLLKAERIRTARRTRARKRAMFVSDPYRFTKTTLEGTKSGSLQSLKEEVEEYLAETHGDEHQWRPLGTCDRIDEVPLPDTPMDIKEPTLKEVTDVVKKARSASAPGPNGIPYKVYKNCPKILKRLWKLLKVVWRKGTIPACWKIAEGCFIPKEEKSESITQFRTISLLNVEGKIFFSMMARRMTAFMTKNQYVDTSVQKGGVPGFSGCIEHTSIITQLIHEAKVNKKDLTVVWLDLANAYGTIPHMLIEEALRHYHIPEHMRGLIRSYFNGIHLRFTTNSFTTAWQKLQKGIVTGCTISVILFVMGMNIFIKAGERETRGPKTGNNIRQPPNRGFMDDLTITTDTHIQARWILRALEETAIWAKMKFKPRKSRSLIIRKGKVSNHVELFVQGERIPPITGNPIKCLGKWFDDTLGDKNNIKRLEQQASEGLRNIDKSGLPGKFKAWMYQHGLLPRLAWPLTLYEIGVSIVEKLERCTSRHLRKWLGVPPSFTSLGLYSRSSKLQLPLTSVVEEFKVGKARLIMTLEESRDDKVRLAGVEVRTGRKWAANKAVSEAKSRLRHKDIVGMVAVGRQGLGSNKSSSWKTADAGQRRSMIQKEIKATEEDTRKARAVELACQGAWTRWETQERALSWADIWKYPQFQLQFLLRAVYDVLPTPANLHRWNLTEAPNCSLCGKRGTLDHILSSCQVSLSQGRYTWRHNQVLHELADVIERERKSADKPIQKKQGHIKFVKEGETAPKRQARTEKGLLDKARDWRLAVDLGQRLTFPEIMPTNLRPDMVLWSPSAKTIVIIELTVPWEERCNEANERKRAKYQHLVDGCREQGWHAFCYPVEIGCRGFPAQSSWHMFAALGITGQRRRSVIQKMAQAAEKSSCWVWLKRDSSSWRPTTAAQ